MKRKNILFLLLICILSFAIFAGMIIYSFARQTTKDKNITNKSNSMNTSEGNKNTISPTNSPSKGNEDKNNVTNTPTNSKVSSTPSPTTTTTPAVSPTPTLSPNIEHSELEDLEASTNSGPIILSFAGDINFDEASKTIARYDRENHGILGGISSDLVGEMKSSHIMLLNNEFSYSTRGVKAANKSYTFRADPKRVNILKEMGVDIVSLANNHAMDYGVDALLDTFTTLDDAQIEYIGAGNNYDRATSPIYYRVGNKTIAYVAASRVVFAMDWYATDTRPGMLGTYDPTEFLKVIQKAKENSDYVVAYVHWGVERNNYPENYQKVMAKQYIDAGADAVIGCHPHVLQGIEFYKGKPIAYSLGNFWFSGYQGSSILLKLLLEDEGAVRLQIVPVKNDNAYTSIINSKQEIEDYYEYMKKISFGIHINDNGFVTQSE